MWSRGAACRVDEDAVCRRASRLRVDCIRQLSATVVTSCSEERGTVVSTNRKIHPAQLSPVLACLVTRSWGHGAVRCAASLSAHASAPPIARPCYAVTSGAESVEVRTDKHLARLLVDDEREDRRRKKAQPQRGPASKHGHRPTLVYERARARQRACMAAPKGGPREVGRVRHIERADGGSQREARSKGGRAVDERAVDEA